ncbi:hypothetical protein GCM10025783_28150 [Amnibacterium soli]|uniref:Phosphotyrosine protein phosphatase I domain-containing protein n=1 Tax=Amnibacterium soli TaxID=1282736 RepID=A0ABP8ZD93_9MICO
MTDHAPTTRGILAVCTANVCRSPLAELHLREALSAGPFHDVVVTSAGTRGVAGAAMCSTARRVLDDPEHGAGHVAREVTRELVEEADLVIAMEREHRGALARLAPGHQGKLFTLREAVPILEAIAREGELPGTVPELVERMRLLRGIVRPPEPEPAPRRRFALLRRPVPESQDDGLSVEDGHNIDHEAHERTVATVRELTGRIGVALRGRA